MSKFVNLGDLINRDRDPAKTAVIDLGGEDGPTEYCFAELDGMTMAVARALTKRGFARGDRIAQLVPAPVQRAELVEVDSLDDTVRGAGGFGSTGR